MSRIDIKAQVSLLKEARMYFKDVKPLADVTVKEKKGGITLTQEHIEEWLEVFYEDRIKMDTCNEATVRR